MDGVAMMFVVASPLSALSTAAQLVPVSLIAPTARTAPSGSADGFGVPLALAVASSTTPGSVEPKFVSATGLLEPDPSATQLTPSEPASSSLTSTMIASTWT